MIIANTASESFNTMATALRSTGVLLVHSPMNEDGGSGESVFRLGERPRAQRGAARVVSGGGTPCCDPPWGTVAEIALRAARTNDFTPIIEQIPASNAELVLSTFVGADLVAL